jgi:hypothetical protein
MAEKKNLNNPNKPARTVTSAKEPAKAGGKSVKVIKKPGYSRAQLQDKKAKNQTTFAYNDKGFTGSKETKKDIRTGKQDYSASYTKSTKKGTQLAANKSARANKKGK